MKSNILLNIRDHEARKDFIFKKNKEVSIISYSEVGYDYIVTYFLNRFPPLISYITGLMVYIFDWVANSLFPRTCHKQSHLPLILWLSDTLNRSPTILALPLTFQNFHAAITILSFSAFVFNRRMDFPVTDHVTNLVGFFLVVLGSAIFLNSN